MQLVDWQIEEEMIAGNIVIEPFDRRQLEGTSYDVRLGEWYYKERKPASGKIELLNPWSEKSLLRMYGNEVHQAQEARALLTAAQIKDLELKPTDRIIIINPGESILGHTEEFIGGKASIEPAMHARSSIGRWQIEVCKCAGWGDPGYINRWTMEITVNPLYHALTFIVGRRIAQIEFTAVEKPVKGNYALNGKYQTDSDLASVMANWMPAQMLPRLYKDWDLKE